MTGTPSPFTLRGVVEGFYGTFYTFPERNDLIRFLGKQGFNFYMYAPKNDRQHRMRWWDPYPDSVMEEFRETVQLAREVGMDFCYSISFGVPINYAAEAEFTIIQQKLKAFYVLGVRHFAVGLDDLPDFLKEDIAGMYASVAEAHADCCNRLLAWLRSLDPACVLYLTSPEYWGKPPFSQYLHDLGRALQPEIPLVYCGPEVVSERITVEDVRAYTEATGRKPLLWDNYPVNDLLMKPELHIGPLRNREGGLAEVCVGYVANAMNQPEASKIPLLTTAEWLRAPERYEAGPAWEKALRLVGGIDAYSALYCFAENSLKSALWPSEAQILDRLTETVLASLERGDPVEGNPAVDGLREYFSRIDESLYFLRNRMHNLALRHDIMPWVEALDDKMWMGRFALNVLADVARRKDLTDQLARLDEMISDVQRSAKRVGGRYLLELALFARRHAERQQRLMEGRQTDDTPAAGD